VERGFRGAAQRIEKNNGKDGEHRRGRKGGSNQNSHTDTEVLKRMAQTLLPQELGDEVAWEGTQKQRTALGV